MLISWAIQLSDDRAEPLSLISSVVMLAMSGITLCPLRMHALDSRSYYEVFICLSVLNKIKVTLVTLAQQAKRGRPDETGTMP